MVLPRSLHHSHHHKFTLKKLALLTVLVLGVSLMYMMSWSSFISNTSLLVQVYEGAESNNKRHEGIHHSHRLDVVQVNAPLPRNGAMLRPEAHDAHRITNYDRQQDIRHYIVTMDKPRVVFLSSFLHSTHKTRSVTPLSTYTPAPNNYNNSTLLSYIWEFERPYYQECTPMASWQTTFYPTCNVLHSILPGTLLSTRGSWRTAWLLDQEEIVLKMLNMDRDYNQESFQHHQTDAMVMERLTKSKYILDVYGYCGQSVLVEFAPNDGRSLIKNKKLSSMGRLILGRDLARGITDIHSMDTPKSRNATFVHNDVNIANIVAMSSGRIKFGDFNIGYPLKWNSTKSCGYPQRFQSNLWRSPEEIRNTTYVNEKTDVYALGNLLFQLMTRHQPWTWLEPNGRPSLEDIAHAKLQGKTPFIPAKFVNSTDLAIQALYHAIRACFTMDPTKRPTSYQISYGLTQALTWMESGNTRMNITNNMFYH